MKYIKELRNRFFLVSLCWMGVFITVYYYKELFLFEILKPTTNSQVIFNYFIFTKVTELFNVHIELASFLSTQTTFIYIMYNFLYFIAPGLYYSEYKLLKFIYKLIISFWVLSSIFLLIFLAPFMWNFFLSFQNKLTHQWIDVQFEAKISDYLDFFITAYYGCNFQFQIFVSLILFLSYFSKNKTSIKQLKKIFYFLFLLIATLLTPPDLISQVLVYISLILFFEFTIVISLVLNKL